MSSYKTIEEYFERTPIKYGRHDTTDLSIFPQLVEESDVELSGIGLKTRGHNGMNSFARVPSENREWLSKYWNSKLGEEFDWGWDYMRSCEPVGLHTDFSNYNGSYLVVGVIIPLHWRAGRDLNWSQLPEGQHPAFTVFYDRRSDVPLKMLYKNDEMRYQDSDEVFKYRDRYHYDWRALKYNPPNTAYFKEYADLTVESVYLWEKNTAIVFDPRQWHSSSWFLEGDKLEDYAGEYKQSIVGFGSIRIPE